MYLILIVILLGGLTFGYFWFKGALKMKQNAQEVISQAQQFEIVNQELENLKQKIEIENSRCLDFIAKQEGDFGSFAYCQKFIDWANILK